MLVVAYVNDSLAFVSWSIGLSPSCDQQLVLEKEDVAIFSFTTRLAPPHRKILLRKEIQQN